MLRRVRVLGSFRTMIYVLTAKSSLLIWHSFLETNHIKVCCLLNEIAIHSYLGITKRTRLCESDIVFRDRTLKSKQVLGRKILVEFIDGQYCLYHFKIKENVHTYNKQLINFEDKSHNTKYLKKKLKLDYFAYNMVIF